MTACFRVYRTYIRNMELPGHATQYIEEAVGAGTNARLHLKARIAFDFVREVLLLPNPPHVLADQREARLGFVMRWQQFTGPIVAKGLEDTALYVYHPLLRSTTLEEIRVRQASSEQEFFSFLTTAAGNGRTP